MIGWKNLTPKEWLGKARSNNEARCKIRHKTFKLSNMEDKL